MTTPANLTYANIETRVMNQLRIPTTNTVEQTKIQALINEVYRDIYVKYDWWFLFKKTALNTRAQYTTGSLNATLGSTTATFSTDAGNPPASTQVNVPSSTVPQPLLIFNGNANDPQAGYNVTAYSTAGLGTLTLDAANTNNTSTAAGYKIYQDKYALPSDCGKILYVTRFGELIPLKPIGLWEFRQLKLSDQSVGRPEAWSIFDFVTTGDPTTARLLQIHPYPDKAYRLEVYYKQQLNTELATTAQAFLPDEYRQILVYGALARGYPIFLNDLERGKYFQSLFNDVLAMMVMAHMEYAGDRPQLVPDDTYRAHLRRRQRTAQTLGSIFDRWPNIP